MGFKTVEMYNQDKYKGKFRIANNGGHADVIFLYQGLSDMLVADTHYIKSASYEGYVHCNGAGCALCAVRKNDGSPRYRKDSMLFIPLYNITNNSIEFWERKISFEPQMSRDVFNPYPNPSEVVFQIVRDGDYKDPDTRYNIRAISRNSIKSYDKILEENHIKFPEYYENIVKEFTNFELESMMSQSSGSNITQDYVPVPRAGYQSSMPNTYVDISSVVGEVTVPEQPTASVKSSMTPVFANVPDVTDADAPIFDGDDGSDDGDLADPIF